MNKATRKTIIAGNWKMNMTPSAAEAAIKETAALVAGKDGCETVLCVPSWTSMLLWLPLRART